MELNEFIAVRRAYTIVRQAIAKEKRITFEEFAILCRLDLRNSSLRTSDIASYQNALRPTTTHRTNRLAELGLIVRIPGMEDRRNVECSISEVGRLAVQKVCASCCAELSRGPVLTRVAPDRLRWYFDAMGVLFFRASDLVLIDLLNRAPDGCKVSQIVGDLGLLQPTISMAVDSLVLEGLARRSGVGVVSLTGVGIAASDELASKVRGIRVRRRRRPQASEAEGASPTSGDAGATSTVGRGGEVR